MILAGDIGGTSARLALFAVESGQLVRRFEGRYPSREFGDLQSIVQRFLALQSTPIRAAGFGIAAPVRDGIARTPNLPWCVDARELARVVPLERVELINDLEANACGIATLPATDLVTLQAGAPGAAGNQAVISAGTGLGEAGMAWDGRVHRPFASEGGHADFAPRNEEEMALLRYLLGRWEHVSYERVLSGPGLHNIYQFLRDTTGIDESPAVRERMRAGDPSSAIAQGAAGGACPLCVRAMDLFAGIYGAEAGNLALKVLATGGVYLGGGIAPKIVHWLAGARFIEAFRAKGRLRALMESMPVQVIRNPDTALAGAARHAALASGLIH